jgi:hypothetical protein
LILLSSSFALFVGGDSLLNSLRDRLVALAAHQARPTKHYLRRIHCGRRPDELRRQHKRREGGAEAAKSIHL